MNEMIFGFRAVIEAVEGGTEIDKILLKKDARSEQVGELYNAVKGRNIPVARVPGEKLDRICRKNHQGVLAFVSPVEYQRTTALVPMLYDEGRLPFLVVLDGVTDTRNFGAIARSCECAGADAIIIPQTGSASVSSDAVKTSAGALLNIPVCREHNLPYVLQFLKDSGIKLVAASEKASKPYTEVDCTGPVAIVLGGEEKGISPEILKLCDESAAIPVLGKTASLNVSVAAGILVYETLRQRSL